MEVRVRVCGSVRVYRSVRVCEACVRVCEGRRCVSACGGDRGEHVWRCESVSVCAGVRCACVEM